MGWGGRWERGSRGSGHNVYLWLIHVHVWQKLTQFCKPIILQLKKKIGVTNKKESTSQGRGHRFNPWSRKIPHAVGQLSQYAKTTAPHALLLPKPAHPRARAQQQEKPVQWEAGAPQLEGSPSHSWREPAHHSKGPVQQT